MPAAAAGGAPHVGCASTHRPGGAVIARARPLSWCRTSIAGCRPRTLPCSTRACSGASQLELTSTRSTAASVVSWLNLGRGTLSVKPEPGAFRSLQGISPADPRAAAKAAHAARARRESTWVLLWLGASLINTCYSYYWDVERDWDVRWFTATTSALQQPPPPPPDVSRTPKPHLSELARCTPYTSPPPPPPPVKHIPPAGHASPVAACQHKVPLTAQQHSSPRHWRGAERTACPVHSLLQSVPLAAARCRACVRQLHGVTARLASPQSCPRAPPASLLSAQLQFAYLAVCAAPRSVGGRSSPLGHCMPVTAHVCRCCTEGGSDASIMAALLLPYTSVLGDEQAAASCQLPAGGPCSARRRRLFGFWPLALRGRHPTLADPALHTN